ncbi:MAG: cupin domain-containing protein [Phycisphaeraceae bacterium]|nr:cupin domain-containing protein [Phycisphaeraceae bacterium]
MLKEHKEFFPVDLTTGFVPVPGYPPGITHKILSGHLDEAKHAGTRTRILRFEPGAFTTELFEHEYWEEVFQLTGDLTVGRDKPETFGPMTYACRPPHTPHGPFSSQEGCLLLEVHFFSPLEPR